MSISYNNNNYTTSTSIRTNYIKVEIDNRQQNSKYKLYGDSDKTINHIISKREYKTRHEWVGKVIHWELCKKLKFDQTTKWHMHKPESTLENEMHKILWDFEIQMDHLIPIRRLDLVITIKKK